MSIAPPAPGLLSRLRALDPERHARRLAPAGVVACAAGVGVGGWPGLALVLVGVALLLTSCVSRDHGLLVFGPFVWLELVRAARRPRPPAAWRALYAAAAFGLFTLIYFALMADAADAGTAPARRLQRAAVTFFGAFAVIQFLFLGALAVRLLAPVVAEERASKRLDFILTTDLRNREILLGKAAGRLPQLLDPVLASLPVLALLPLFGGVPPEYAEVAAAATLATVLGIAGVAFFASVISPTRDTAVSTANSLCIAYVVLSAIACALTAWPTFWGFPESVGVPSPVNVADVILAAAAGNPFVAAPQTGLEIQGGTEPGEAVVRAVRRYVVFHLGVGGVFGLMAAARLRAVVVRDPPTGPTPQTALRTLRRPRPPVTDEAVFWAEAYRHPRAASLAGWRADARRLAAVGLWAVVVLHLVAVVLEQHRSWRTGIASLAACGLGAAAVLGAGNRATGTVLRERKADTLEALLLTGLGCRVVLRQKWRACAFAPLALYSLAAGVTAAGLVLGSVHPLLAAGLAVGVPAHAAVAVSLGVYCSVRTASANQAAALMMATGAVLVVVPGTLIGLAASELGGPAGTESPRALPFLAAAAVGWVLACAGLAVLFWRLAVRRFEWEWEGRR
jgi:hypothetical protein